MLVFRIPQGPKSPSTSTTPIRKSVSVASELEMEPMLPLDPVTDAYLKSKGHHDNLIQILESSTEGYGLEKTDKVSVCSVVSARWCLLVGVCSLVSARWCLLVGVCSLVSARWCLLGGVCSVVSARWCLLVGVCSLVSARWCLLVGVCSVVSARWCLLGGVCSLVSARWCLLVSVCSLVSARWCLLVGVIMYGIYYFWDTFTTQNVLLVKALSEVSLSEYSEENPIINYISPPHM